MVCLIPCFYVSIDLFFPYIMYMFLGLGQKAWHPCFLGVFSFICWSLFLLFFYIVYMLTKTNVTCVPKLVLYNGQPQVVDLFLGKFHVILIRLQLGM
jgi:hypothetical protein